MGIKLEVSKYQLQEWEDDKSQMLSKKSNARRQDDKS